MTKSRRKNIVKIKKFIAALVSGAMLFGMAASAVPAPVVIQAAEGETARVEVTCDYAYFKLTTDGLYIPISAEAYDSNGKLVKNDIFTWSLEVDGEKIEGNSSGEDTDESIFLNQNFGHYTYLGIGAGVEEGTKIKITATSSNNPEISSSYTAAVDTSLKAVASIKLETDSEYEPGEINTCIVFSVLGYTADGIWIWDWEPEPGQIDWDADGIPKWEAEPDDLYKMDDEGYDRIFQSGFLEDDNLYPSLYIRKEEDIGKEITVSAVWGTLSTSSVVTVWKRMASEISLEDSDIPEIVELGLEEPWDISLYPYVFDQYGNYIEEYDSTEAGITWSVTGVPRWTQALEDSDGEGKKSYYKLAEDDGYEGNDLSLYIGTEEKNGTKITLTATSKSNSSVFISHTITVFRLSTTSIDLKYRNGDKDKYTAPGEVVEISAQPYDQNHNPIEDTINWSVTGAKNFIDIDKLSGALTKEQVKEQTYFEKKSNTTASLHIGEKESVGTEITVTATSGNDSSVSNSCTITVYEGVSLDINYIEGSANLRSNKGDSFLFLEICKKKDDPKGKGTIYCYEGDDISLDLSFMKLSKEVNVYVYGDVNTDPVAYTIAAQPKKASVKFKYDSKKTFAEYFTLGNNLKIEDFEYRRQNDTSWKPLSDLEEELDQLMVAGANLLVRQSGTDTKEKKNMPGTEIKLKISAAPKAPKIKLNYAKNTITLVKNSQIRVPGWEIFSTKPNADGKYDKVPFYYSLGETKDKDKLNPSPADLAETLVKEYVTAYNASVGELKKHGRSERELTDKDQEKLLDELKDGCTLLIRTSDSKKGNSQPAFTELKAAPVIGLKPKTTSGTAVVAVVTGENTYGNDTVTVTYGKDEQPGKETLKLTASNDNLFAYSIDGKKFTKIKKGGTTVKLSTVTGSDIIIRMEGAEDKKDAAKSRWASNNVMIPKTEN